QITRNPRRTSSPTRPDLVFATHNHMRKQTAARRSLLKELSALKHLLFLPSLIAPLVKESGAVSAAHIGSREAFNALMAVRGTLFRVLCIDPRRLNPKVR